MVQYKLIGTHINCVDGEWKVAGNYFFRRKSAVGYYIRPLKNDSIKARQVQEADKQLLKIKQTLIFIIIICKEQKMVDKLHLVIE